VGSVGDGSPTFLCAIDPEGKDDGVKFGARADKLKEE
jgi:hypothetical protein